MPSHSDDHSLGHSLLFALTAVLFSAENVSLPTGAPGMDSHHLYGNPVARRVAVKGEELKLKRFVAGADPDFVASDPQVGARKVAGAASGKASVESHNAEQLVVAATGENVEVEEDHAEDTSAGSSQTEEINTTGNESRRQVEWEDPYGAMTSRELAYLEFIDYVERELYQDAMTAAEHVVKLTEAQFGKDHLEMVTPLNNLATVQEQLAYFDASGANYQRGIEILERKLGNDAERLVRPLMGLGVTYNAAGKYARGLLAFQRAQFITHRRHGVWNLDQIDIIDGITQSYLGLDEFAEADRSQRLAFVISERKLGKDSVELVPAIHRLAKWYQRTFQYSHQRDLYRRALEILEVRNGPDDSSLIEPLRGIATSRYLEGLRRAEGEKALERVVSIIREQPMRPTERVRALVDLGDWYIVSDKAADALALYKQAWALMDVYTHLSDHRLSLFGRPTRLLYYGPVGALGDVSNKVEDRFVDVEFTVTSRGRVADIKVVEANVRNIIVREVKFAIARARYRPRVLFGVAVDTPKVRFRQAFRAPPVTDEQRQ